MHQRYANQLASNQKDHTPLVHIQKPAQALQEPRTLVSHKLWSWHDRSFRLQA